MFLDLGDGRDFLVRASRAYSGAIRESIVAGASSGSISATAGGLAVGPFLGYKIIAGPGFTFDVQAGVEYMAVAASSSSGSTGSVKTVIPLLNLNVGWSL